MDVRAQFTIAHSKWSRSGQNEATHFHRLWSKIDSTDGASAPTTEEKRCLIMFYVLGCGAEHERESVTSFVLRSLPSEAIVETGLENPGTLAPTNSRKRALSAIFSSM